MATGGARHDWRRAHAIRLTWPVAEETMARLLTGQSVALEGDPSLAKLLAVLRSGGPLGDFGAYQAVAELAPGWELFRPGPQANPTLGEAGRNQHSPSAMITIHVPADADPAQLDAAIDALMDAHPWEIPVMEIVEVRLATRTGQA